MPEGETAPHPPPFLPSSVLLRHAASTSAGLAGSAASRAGPVPDEYCGAAAAPAPASIASMGTRRSRGRFSLPNGARSRDAGARTLVKACPRSLDPMAAPRCFLR